MDFAQPPVRRVVVAPDATLDARLWPATIPAVGQLMADGLDLGPGVTFLVGENGSGKSTLVEGIAMAFGLRAETMHGWYSYIEENPNERNPDPRFHELSHGESFIALLQTRFDSGGFYCLDEPEAALSFSSTLALIAVLQRLARDGGQVLCATHSPVLASLPGARILEVGDWGWRESRWEDLALVDHWRRFLETPQSYLRHLEEE